MIFAWILYIEFGQVTVRRLRKIPKLKETLGMEIVSGADILNVAMALSLPRWLARKASRSKVSFLFADSDLLYRHTTLFDRVLARFMYWIFMISGISLTIVLIFVKFPKV